MTGPRTVDTVARGVGDLVRLAILASGLVVLIWLSGSGVTFFLLFLVLLPPRLLRIPAPFDAAAAATLLAATWARQQGWYVTVPWADEVVHAVTPGATAAVVYLCLGRLDLLPSPREVAGATRRLSLALLVTCVGLGLAAVWEMVEWVENEVEPRATHVGYTDTVSDLALGGLGSLVAGLLLVGWYAWRSPAQRRT